MISPARVVAAEVLARVFAEDAFASLTLDAEIQRAGIAGRDAALATELVYGVLRTEGFLDEHVAKLSRRAYAKDARVRAHLLMGAYSIAFLDRVPVFAAVSEAVAGARAAAGERVAGFANAVLRAFTSSVEAKGRPALTEAIAASAPGWLRGALRRSLGRAGTAAYLAAGPVPPPIGLCVAPGENREAWVAKLAEAAPNATFAAGSVSPRAILVRGAGDVRRLPGVGSAWIVQEEGAQVIALAAGAHAGERVLDACAGHGNKTWLLAHEVGSSGAVDASDLHPQKLAELRAGPAGANVHETFAIDWTAGTGRVGDDYDVVLIDAPCSGVGTLRRRPEIGRRREEEDLPRLAELEASIARRAATRARNGGRVIYAVCSVLREEGEEVVARLVEGDALGVKLEPAPFPGAIARELAGGEAVLRVLPHVHGTDGYFMASFVARK